MGSAVHYSLLKAFDEKFGAKILEHYKYLIGRAVIGMSEYEYFFHKKADVALDNGEVFEVHFGWTTEEGTEEEVNDLDEMNSEEYFNMYLKDKKITGVDVGYDRDDMYYLYLISEGDTLEVPMAFNAYECELYDYSIITEKEFEEFLEQLN